MSGILKYKNENGEWVGIDAIRGENGADGTMSFDDLTPEQKASLKGDKGDTGEQGIQGPQGIQGERGPQGIQGPAGPKGDNGSDALATDVQINGTSITSECVANIPIGRGTLGTVMVSSSGGYGLSVNATNGSLTIVSAGTSHIDAREHNYRPIVPSNLDYAVKAALTDGKGAAYTDAEKSAAQTRLGLSTVASTGSYEDLSDTPTLFSGNYNDLTNKPTTVAGYGITNAYTKTEIDNKLGDISAILTEMGL